MMRGSGVTDDVYDVKRGYRKDTLQDGYALTEVSGVLPGIRRQDLTHFLVTA